MIEEYFLWLCRLVDRQPEEYMRALYSTPFEYESEYDENRRMDGIALRYNFGEHYHLSEPEIMHTIDTRECSMLEMMVALACRMDDIMYDASKGVRTGVWFSHMLVNLGIGSFSDRATIQDICQDYCRRRYNPDGRGGMFFVPASDNMNKIDIWYQAQEYLCYIDPEGGSIM